MDRDQLLNDAEQAMRLVLDGRQSCIWTTLPGIVTAVDLTKMTCEVQPAIQGTIEDENGKLQAVNLPLLVDVPIVFPRGGGFLITLPLAVDDEVLVSFASRCIDAWWQSGGIQRPMEARMHDLSDGFAIPGPWSQRNLPAGVSSTGAQIRNLDGDAYVEISADGKIKLVSPSEIDVTGDLKVTGTITATTDVKVGVVSLKLHTHPVTTAPGTTGVPT